MKSALVTGGGGFIGSHLVDRLVAEGWLVTVVDNSTPFMTQLLNAGILFPIGNIKTIISSP